MIEVATAVSWALPAAMAVTGFMSGVHCLGMCGGIVTAFGARDIRFASERGRSAELVRQLLFNAGRVTSYALAGALVAGLSSAGVWITGAWPWQTAFYVLANLMLVVVGFHLAGVGRWIDRLGEWGMPLWRRVQPLAARLLRARSSYGNYGAGLLWGWLPCGLVYGALTAAAFTGRPASGALTMAAFGLGTLPNMLLAGLAAARLRAWAARRWVRTIAGTLVAGFGVIGLAHAGRIAERIRDGILCL